MLNSLSLLRDFSAVSHSSDVVCPGNIAGISSKTASDWSLVSGCKRANIKSLFKTLARRSRCSTAGMNLAFTSKNIALFAFFSKSTSNLTLRHSTDVVMDELWSSSPFTSVSRREIPWSLVMVISNLLNVPGSRKLHSNRMVWRVSCCSLS